MVKLLFVERNFQKIENSWILMSIKTEISSSNYSKLSQSLKKYLGRVKTIFHHIFRNSWNVIFRKLKIHGF